MKTISSYPSNVLERMAVHSFCHIASGNGVLPYSHETKGNTKPFFSQRCVWNQYVCPPYFYWQILENASPTVPVAPDLNIKWEANFPITTASEEAQKFFNQGLKKVLFCVCIQSCGG